MADREQHLPTSGGVKVNFQPAVAPTVAGYLVDSGQVYGARGNGQTYGWTTSHASAVVDRNVNSNQLLDTNVGVIASTRWELAVPNGTYTVRISVGDASAASRNNIWLEGSNNLFPYISLEGSNNLFPYISLAANNFQTRTTTINVTDGRLTVAVGGAATGETRINFIEIV